MADEGKIIGEWKAYKTKVPITVDLEKPALSTKINVEVNPTDNKKTLYFNFLRTTRNLKYVLININESPVLFRFIPEKEFDEVKEYIDFFTLYEGQYIFEIRAIGFEVKPIEDATTKSLIEVTAFF